MTNKHTTGPWEIDDGYIRAIWGPRIAYMTDYDRDYEYDYRYDARLIAAAPDLLAALESVIESCDNDLQGTDKPRGLEQARAAIARARGES